MALSPVTAVQSAVLDRLSKMGNGKPFGAFEIGDGACHFKDTVVSAGREALLLHGAFKQAFGIGAKFAVHSNLACRHLGVGEDLFAGNLEPGSLAVASSHHAGANLGGTFGGGPSAQLLILDGRNFDMNIDAVEERPGDFGDVPLDHGWGAEAFPRLVVEISTGAGIHGGGQHEARGEGERHGSACDGHGVVFKRLAHDFEYVAGKLGQLVEEEQAIVSKGDFAGTRNDSTPDESGSEMV